MVDDAILQQSLTEVNPFLWVSRLTNFHQPRHKLTEETKKIATLRTNTHEIPAGNIIIPLWRMCAIGRESFEFSLDYLKTGKKTQTPRSTQYFI